MLISIARIQRFYQQRILPSTSHIRGFHRVNHELEKLAKRGLETVEESQPSTVDELDWDNLVVIDACRADLFKSTVSWCHTRVSSGSATPDFISQNFSNQDFQDTVLIAGNPQFHPEVFKQYTGRKPSDVFHEVFPTYRTGWSEAENCTLPGSVTQDALTAQKLFPEKRLLVFYLQPHHPFIESNFDENGFVQDDLHDEDLSHETAWDKAERGKIGHEEVVDGYQRNLELVYEEIKENLVPGLDGRVVLTSDHGNFVGENGYYGHNRGCDGYVALRYVPLKVLQERKEGGGAVK